MSIEAVSSCSFPVTDGNKLTFYIDGFESMQALVMAIEKAEQSVWITASYFDANLPLPQPAPANTIDPGRKLLSFLEERAKEGIDVRILFWTTNIHGIVDRYQGKTFSHHDETLQLLKDQKIEKVKIRWDEKKSWYRIETGCHHQKSVIIDGALSFCGGVNMVSSYIDLCEHPSPHPYSQYDSEALSIHDFFVKVQGPATACIQANFVQRWNEASLYKDDQNSAYPDPASANNLPWPAGALYNPDNGVSKVQVVRTIDRGIYRQDIPAPDWPVYQIQQGEQSIFQSYVEAIKNAEQYVYIENQYFYYNGVGAGQIFDALHDAARTGNVKIFVVVPSNRLFQQEARDTSLSHLYALSGKNVQIMNMVSSIAQQGKNQWNEVYIHAKLMMVDDVWMTVGSANISNQSFVSDSELNLSIWDPYAVKDLRIALWSRYLECDKEMLMGATMDQAFDLFDRKLKENSAGPIPPPGVVTVLPWTAPPDLFRP